MDKMALKYGLDDTPPVTECVLLGLQWLAIVVPVVIILGKVAAGVHTDNSVGQDVYIQKLFLVSGVSLLAQILWGHRLPLIVGPATVLLVGIVASRENGANAVYSAIAVGGGILAVLSITGLFGQLKRLFTPRVVATILIMIAFTLAPMIQDLIIASPGTANPPDNSVFALVLVLLLFVANRYFTGIWKATLIIWGIMAGSLTYLFLFPQPVGAGKNVPTPFAFLTGLHIHPAIEPGVLISFLICFLALSINDLGSIESVGEMVQPGHMQNRITRGISLTGLSNILAGLLGVIGPVNFSLSAGVIASTGIASRFTLIPTALGLLLLSFWPQAIALLGSIPSVVIGSALIYIMCSQIAAGLLMVFKSMREFRFEHGLVMGFPLMLAVIISFLPGSTVGTFPPLLSPVAGNGFVVGTLAVLFMEHVMYRERKQDAESPGQTGGSR